MTKQNDIVERLRKWERPYNPDGNIFTEAADEIERLRAGARTGSSRDETIEECAQVLDKAAQDCRRIRDPGMANNAAAYARRIRALSRTQRNSDGGSK